MFKKILKSCLAAVISFSLSSAVMAEEPTGPQGPVIKGEVKGYVGQFSDGVDGHEAFTKTDGEAKFLVFVPFAKKFTGMVIVEANFLDEFQAYSQHAKYKATDSFALVLGDRQVPGGILFSDSSGSVAEPVWRDSDSGPAWDPDYIKGVGLHADLTIAPAAKIEAGYLGHFPFEEPDMEGSGYGSYITLSGTIGDFEYRASVISGTQNEASTDTDDENTKSVTRVGVKYTIPDILSVSLDYVSATGEVDRGAPVLIDEEQVDTAAQITVFQIGPGDIVLTYATETPKDTDSTIYTNVVYDNLFAMDGGALQLIYLSKKIPGATDADDDRTETFAGLGMKATF